MNQLLLILTIFAFLGCRGNSSEQPESDGQVSSLNACSQTYRICPGDHLWDFAWGRWEQKKTPKPVYDRTVSEVVPAGELSRDEVAYLQRTIPEMRGFIERTLRANAQQAGVRIIMNSVPGVFTANSFAETDNFSSLFRPSGCDENQGVCAGDEYKVFIYDPEATHVNGWLINSQKFLGTEIKSNQTPRYLVMDADSSGQSRALKTTDKDIIVLQTERGCARISTLDHDFCVGDQFYTNSRVDIISFEVVAVTVPKVGAKSELITKSAEKLDTFSKAHGSQAPVYVSSGCVPGVDDICLPARPDDQVLVAEKNGQYGPGWYARAPIHPANIAAIVLPKQSLQVPEVLIPFGYRPGLEEVTAWFAGENFYHTVGCGTSAHICAGDNIEVVMYSKKTSVHIVGYSNASDQILGKISSDNRELNIILPTGSFRP